MSDIFEERNRSHNFPHAVLSYVFYLHYAGLYKTGSVCSHILPVFCLFWTFWFLTCLLLFNSISAYQNCIPEKLRKKTRMWLYRVRSNRRKHRSQAKAPAAKSADNYNEIQKLTVSFSEGINSIGGVQNISNAALNVGVNLPDKWKVAARARGGHLSWSRT